ncbi:myosin-2 heavy chain-like protein [Trema orientale]|uniref:Myosin-2 heavy chain-like protein n=1 Tax=Trema orientale TaxID=63057 RepID=A0A2P5EYG6_TREOI|nr:myosin-2 heavy chain-like protein [Trema orientale]
MDLGCLDMGCVSVWDKNFTPEPVLDSHNKENDAVEPLTVTATSKIGKNKHLKENGQSTLSSLNKFASQIKKPGHRKASPINWFPRKKVDSYLNRKIKMLQEVSGMNLTLDETLGDSNPHYSKVLKEKMAAKEAANKAIEARKAALVEASWCRILKASRIQSKEAEAQLQKAEKTAAEAFEAALAIGVIMYDIPNCPQKTCHVETSSSREGSTTHAVTASFETAFEVDIEVAAAVKTALVRLANCPSIKKDEFKDLIRKISQNPDTSDNDEDQSEDSSPKSGSSCGPELETVSQGSDRKTPASQLRQRKSKRRQSLEKFNMTKLVNMMFDRLQRLQEDELSSLATIVATCGLNAALAEIQNNKHHDSVSAADYASNSGIGFQRRLSSWGAGKLESFRDGHIKKKQTETELPSLDKFLVKHMTKLEKEVQEARNSWKKESNEGIPKHANTSDVNADSNNGATSSEIITELGCIPLKNSSKIAKEIEDAKKNSVGDFNLGHKNFQGDAISSEAIPDLGSMLIKHSSKLEKEVEEARRNCGRSLEGLPTRAVSHTKEDITELPSLDKFLMKHVSRLEKEVEEAKNRRKNDAHEGSTAMNLKNKVNSSDSVTQLDRTSSLDSEEGLKGKENVDSNKEAEMSLERNEVDPSVQIGKQNLAHQSRKAPTKETEDGLDKILVKPVHRLEREKMQALASNYRYDKPQKKQKGNIDTECESLDKVLIKHVSRLEKEKMRLGSEEESMKVKKNTTNMNPHNEEAGGLDQIMVKHKSRLEREKLNAAQQPEEHIRSSVARREARERELNEAWGGLSLGNSMKPHLSRLERDKAAWIKAEEEERKQAMPSSD